MQYLIAIHFQQETMVYTKKRIIYIYAGGALFGPAKPESGIIPSEPKKSFNYEHLNFPGKALNVTDIKSNNSFKKKNGHIRIINLFPSCYGYWYESIT